MATNKDNSNRTCFMCINSNVCIMFKTTIETAKGISVNHDSNDTPGTFKDIFKAIANCCLHFKTVETQAR